MNIAVSVIVPVYNREDLIERCVKSVLSQTLENIEVIAVDDGSDDGTLSVLRGIKDERLRIIEQKNTGQGFARNTGIAAARGEYLAFVDSDDTIEREMLEKMYDRAKADGSDVVQCNIYDIYPDGSVRIQLKYDDALAVVSNAGEYTDMYFTACIHSYEVCNKLIRRGFLEKTGVKFRDTRKYFSEDLLFNLELLEHIKRVSFIKEAYYNYYQYGGSHLHSDAEKRLEGVRRLFSDYLARADGEMRSAVSYTAAMIIAYNAGACAKSNFDAAKKALSGVYKERYLKEALRRKCSLKRGMFLALMYISAPSVRVKLAEKYSGRWAG